MALDHLDLSISAGLIFGFLGPNGGGKTTTVRILCGILAPTSDRAAVLGFGSHLEADRVKEVIGYVSQSFLLYRNLTVEENLLFYFLALRCSFTRREFRIVGTLQARSLRRARVHSLSPGKSQ